MQIEERGAAVGKVAKGFELLGHKDKDEVRLRLGGIYALEGVMNASDQYHQPVLETLCAFVRDQPQTSNDTPQLRTSRPR